LRKGAFGRAKVAVNGSVIATRDYSPAGFSTPPRTLKAGTTCIVLEVHGGGGFYGHVTRLSVRNPRTGEVFRRVPAEVFAR
jgi:hypothetical protein